MVSNAKRMRYISENTTSSEDDSYEEMIYQSKKENDFTSNRSRRKPRCLSKNALMARENRLKKKMYVNKLENQVSSLKTENRNLTSVIKNQSLLVTDLKKEVKYLKSIIANSGDIKNLIRNIHSSTGMSVSSSLDKNCSLKTISVPKKNLDRMAGDFNLNTDCLLGEDVNLSMNWHEDLSNFPLTIPDDVFNENLSPYFEEHNYTSLRDSDDVGVCLHVSKHRVSLEFCNTCSDKAQDSWMNP